jgi:hypothetical protein
MQENTMIERTDFGSVENVLRFIQERSDDIERVVIPQAASLQDSQTGKVIPNVGLIIWWVDRKKSFIFHEAAELVLNDGILNRMQIRIELRTTDF